MMVRTQVQLTVEQYKALKNLATRRQVSVAELVRQSVDMLIESSESISKEERIRRALSIVGRFHSGEKGANISENHDDYLADIYAS